MKKTGKCSMPALTLSPCNCLSGSNEFVFEFLSFFYFFILFLTFRRIINRFLFFFFFLFLSFRRILYRFLFFYGLFFCFLLFIAFALFEAFSYSISHNFDDQSYRFRRIIIRWDWKINFCRKRPRRAQTR